MDYLGGDEPDPYPPPAPPSSHHQQQPLNPETSDPQTPLTNLQPFSPSPYATTTDDPYNGMPPPPEITYADLPTLMEACQNHGRAHGYACVTSSNNYKRGIAYVRCDRGGEYVNHWNVTPETRVRKNRTRRLVGCKWKARAKRIGENGEWQLTMMEDKHNGHGPSEDLSTHPSLRQLSGEATNAAKEAFTNGRSPKEVLELLKRWNPVVTAQDVYNLKAKITRKDGGGAGRKGTSLKGQMGAESGGTPKGANGGEGDGIVDPALRAQDPSLDGFGHLTAAVAQMQEPNGRSLPLQNGEPSTRKCACTCCEH